MKRFGLIFLFVLGMGCGGPNTGNVSGKVTVNGQPLPAGMLIITGENQKSITADIKDGNYAVANVPLGKAMIAIRDSPAAPDPMKVDVSKLARAPALVPKKYEKNETSGLTLIVVKGENDFPIDLK